MSSDHDHDLLGFVGSILVPPKFQEDLVSQAEGVDRQQEADQGEEKVPHCPWLLLRRERVGGTVAIRAGA